MNTMPMPEPSDRDVEKAVADMEKFIADQAPAAPVRSIAPVESKRVRELRAEVGEAHALLELQGDAAPLLVDTDRVRRSRKRAAEAARLHALAQDPAARAWQAARWRSAITAAGMTALVLALGWSTANVHAFVAGDAAAWSAVWVFGWLVEPFLSLALLTVVGARAYMGTRGRPLDHPTLRRIEWLFLGLTLLMNTWRYLPGVAERFSFAELVLHALGPVVAVAVVTALPIVWNAFAGLDHGGPTGQPYPAPTPAKYSGNVPGDAAAEQPDTGRSTALLAARARQMIASGTLPADPSATKLRDALGCGTDAAREVRDALRGGAA